MGAVSAAPIFLPLGGFVAKVNGTIVYSDDPVLDGAIANIYAAVDGLPDDDTLLVLAECFAVKALGSSGLSLQQAQQMVLEKLADTYSRAGLT